MRKAISISTTMDDKERSMPRSIPAESPANAECNIASEKNDILRSTTKFPTNGQSMPTIIEASNALWINGYDKNSLIVFMTAVYIRSHHFSINAFDDLICEHLCRLTAASQFPVHAEDIICKAV